MHKNCVIKGYDQSVTCLADDPRNLEIRSNKRHTSGILSQTNKHTISNQARCTSKTHIRRSNQKVQLKNSGLQKESNQTKQRKSNGEKTSFVY